MSGRLRTPRAAAARAGRADASAARRTLAAVRDALEQLSRHPAGDSVDPLVASVRGLAVAADATELEADQIAGIVRDYPDAARAIAAASTAQDMVRVATLLFEGKDAGEGHSETSRDRARRERARLASPHHDASRAQSVQLVPG